MMFITLEIILRNISTDLRHDHFTHVISKRWIVERTFGWFNFNSRLTKDYEAINENSVAFGHLTMIRITLNKNKNQNQSCPNSTTMD